MEPIPTTWWRYIPERPWPAWLYLVGPVIIIVSTYFQVVLGGAIGFLAGLAVYLLGGLVFVGWMRIRWRAKWGPRTRARNR